MEDVLGVYICSGCGIGEALNLEAPTKVATNEYKAKVCKTHECLCGEQGVQMIKDDIESEGLNKVLLAACSPRVMTDVFSFGDTTVERANFREHLAWCHEPKDEDTDMIAEDMIRMSVVKLQKSKVIEPLITETFSKTVMVIGGGISGMQSALSAGAAGYDVVLVEKEDKLGGYLNRIFKDFDYNPPYNQIKEPGSEEWTAKVEANEKITVHLGTEVESVKGQPGDFNVTLKNGENFVVGSIVVAAGAKEYDPAKLDYLGYGKSEKIVTRSQFEQIAKEGNFVKGSGGEPAKYAFIQCAGSRDSEHLPYCSATCCLESLKQAKYIREKDPEAQIFIFYKDMRTIGQYENFYWTALDEDNLFMTRGAIKAVEPSGDQVAVTIDDELVGEDVSTIVDMVILANGMVPNTSENEVLHLEYRQGPELPEAKYGFPDSEFICFPYETRRTAIYAAGAVRQPMDPSMTLDDANGAALKAIQAMECYSKGTVVHPRALDLTWPDFDLSRCTQCKRCTEECPFGALDEDEKGTPLTNPNRCRRCGICMGACPERIVNFQNYSVDMVASMIKACEVPEEDEEKPRVLALICENDAYPTLDLLGLNKIKYSPYIRFIPVRCLGSINIVWISSALDAGFDSVLLIGCKHGDDYQCHFIKGSELANTRMENVQEKLETMMLESERVQIHEISLTEYDKLPQIIEDMIETVEEVGPNPFKDM